MQDRYDNMGVMTTNDIMQHHKNTVGVTYY